MSVRAIRIAVLAMGGEGGGVLADWIAGLARANGYLAQLTSVPGVAQRTGATIYYLELFPRAEAERVGRPPVLALMPVPGDVDIVVASELMEAARAVERGLVTPDRTVLVASTNRVYAMIEKMALADGRSDSAPLIAACRQAAKALYAADLAAIAEASASVISAALFGALARSGALPFPRQAFEATIAGAGVGVEASQRAFAAAFNAVGEEPEPMVAAQPVVEKIAGVPFAVHEAARAIVIEGIVRLNDYQDRAYAEVYIERLAPIAAADARHGDGSGRLIAETARYLTLGMAYEDTIRVAELKTRADRFRRVAEEAGAKPGQIVEIAEFLHPRLQEIAESVPAPLGRFLQGNRVARAVVGGLTRKGRIVKTSSISGFLLLSAVAGLKGRRRSSLRYAAEQASLEAWLAKILAVTPRDYVLAVEVAECRTLVKGYGDTHARGLASYTSILDLLPKLDGRGDAASVVANLRQAALADDTGVALERAMATAAL